MKNIILLADAYKYSHHKLYYPGTTHIYSYLESRGGKFDNTVFFGLQYFLKEYLSGQSFTQKDLDEAAEFLPKVFNRNDVFDKEKFQYILDRYNGFLPVRIKAVPEGTVVPVNNVLMTIENTDPKCFWLTNFLETLLMQVWYPCTVATLSREIKKTISDYFDQTATEEAYAGLEFILNDFGLRGVSSVESAALGGSAHLINFLGSDNLVGSQLIQKYYNTKDVYSKSIPATEHSICTLLGPKGESEIYRHLLNTFPNGIIACVSDSYNIFHACEKYWGDLFKDQIMERDGVLVIRPDSGDPTKTLLTLFDILFQQFGYTINNKGYKVLPPQIRVIQGDGVNYESICDIYAQLSANTISAENLVLGMGGALLQKVDRDTQKFAIKCSHAIVNGEEVNVQKSPVEMDGNGQLHESFKKSKSGRLKLIQTESGLKTIQENDPNPAENHLVTVFENGVLVRDWQFEEIRERAQVQHNLEQV
ncbi:MAG: nicotinate phosphoribosyltransferase [Cytophagaceae bacterium]